MPEVIPEPKIIIPEPNIKSDQVLELATTSLPVYILVEYKRMECPCDYSRCKCTELSTPYIV